MIKGLKGLPARGGQGWKPWGLGRGSLCRTGRVAVAQLRVAVERRERVDPAQILKAEPIGYAGASALGFEDGRQHQSFCSEWLDGQVVS